jgi:L-asparagine transporter-like permease
MTENDQGPSGTPRWVKVSAIIALVVVGLIVVLLIAGRGGHGPGRHVLGGDGSLAHTALRVGVTHEQQ